MSAETLIKDSTKKLSIELPDRFVILEGFQ